MTIEREKKINKESDRQDKTDRQKERKRHIEGRE